MHKRTFVPTIMCGIFPAFESLQKVCTTGKKQLFFTDIKIQGAPYFTNSYWIRGIRLIISERLGCSSTICDPVVVVRPGGQAIAACDVVINM